jgi:hypothetical protein
MKVKLSLILKISLLTLFFNVKMIRHVYLIKKLKMGEEYYEREIKQLIIHILERIIYSLNL